MKFTYKLTVVILLLCVTIFIALTWLRYGDLKRNLIQTMDKTLDLSARIAEKSLIDAMSGETNTSANKEYIISPHYSKLRRDLSLDFLMSLSLNSENKRIIGSDYSGRMQQAVFDALFRLLNSVEIRVKKISNKPVYYDVTDNEQRFRIVIYHIAGDNDEHYLCVVGADYKNINERLQNNLIHSAGILLCLLTGGLFVSFYLARSYTKPLNQLSSELLDISEGRATELKTLTIQKEYSRIEGTVQKMLHVYHANEARLGEHYEHLDMERRKLFAIFHNIGEDIYIVDPETLQIVFTNRTINGETPEMLAGRLCFQTLFGYDSQCPFCTNRIAQKLQPDCYRWDFFDTKRQRHFGMIDRMIRWPDGRNVCLHFAIDITARKQIEDKNNVLLERYQIQAEQLSVREKELRLVNEGLEIQTEALIQSEEDLKARQEELATTNRVLSKQSSQLEEQKQHLNEQNTALEKAKKEVEDKAVELETTSRYKSEFLANMSHELRTPLNSILLLSRYLSEDSTQNLTTKQRECAETVYSSGNELLVLINEVLDLTQVESGNMLLEPHSIDLAEIGRDLERKFRPVADDKSLEFNVHIDDGVPDLIRTDPMRLAQILRNLLSNAFKFTEVGTVTLEICFRDQDLPVILSVRDTGNGIPEDKKEIVFHAFKQADGSTSRKYGGTGLGLSISREYSIALGGRLELESSIGKGSLFSLSLPVDINAALTVPIQNGKNSVIRQPENAPKTNNSGLFSRNSEQVYFQRFKGKKVLLADDDMRNVFSLISVLESKGMEIVVARTGIEAVSLLIENKDTDIVLMDIMMPEMDGYQAIKEIRHMRVPVSGIPVIALTAKAMTGDKEKCLRAGATDYLSKPVDIDRLFLMMQEYLS